MTPASNPSAAALRYAAPVSDALYAINERGLDCTPIRGEDPAPIDSLYSTRVEFNQSGVRSNNAMRRGG